MADYINIAQLFFEAFGLEDITSTEMKTAITQWYGLYKLNAVDCNNGNSLGIPRVIVDGLERPVFGEYQATVDEDTPKGKAVAEALQAINKNRKYFFDQTMIGAEGFIKPSPVKGKFVYSFIPRPNFLAFARDAEGNITSLGTSCTTVKQEGRKRAYYTLIEWRIVDDNGYLTVHSRLYRSEGDKYATKPVPLNSIPEYADFQEEITYPVPIGNLGLVHIKTPTANCIDDSRDGVSFYASAVPEILKLYRHETRTDDEYEFTEPRAFVSTDALPVQMRPNFDPSELPDGPYMRREELPRVIFPMPGMGVTNEGVGFQIYNPVPNQQQLEARENQKLRNIENLINMYRGFLAHVENMDRTATEVTSSMEKAAHTISALQEMWENAQDELMQTCDVLAQIFDIEGWDNSPLPVINVEWGNGILYDEEKEWNRLNMAVSSGHAIPEYIPIWLELPELTDEQIEEARKRMPDLSTPEDGEKEELI